MFSTTLSCKDDLAKVSFQSTATIQEETPITKSETTAEKQTAKKRHTTGGAYESDLVVVLDMDECLIHSQFLSGSSGPTFAHQTARSDSSLIWLDPSTSVDTFHTMLPNGEIVYVSQRPYLLEILKDVSERYETHLFTAATEVYAKPVLEVLDPDGSIFTQCWFRDSCTLNSNLGAYVKNLGHTWGGEQLKRTVLVDNNPLSFIANPENGILVSSFYDDPHDTALPRVLDLLEELEDQDDVRPVLDARFGLRQALDDVAASINKKEVGAFDTIPTTLPSKPQVEQVFATAPGY